MPRNCRVWDGIDSCAANMARRFASQFFFNGHHIDQSPPAWAMLLMRLVPHHRYQRVHVATGHKSKHPLFDFEKMFEQFHMHGLNLDKQAAGPTTLVPVEYRAFQPCPDLRLIATRLAVAQDTKVPAETCHGGSSSLRHRSTDMHPTSRVPSSPVP